jgi:hypothetical protein
VPQDSAPGGVWKISFVHGTYTTRGGTTKKVTKSPPSVWTFQPSSCNAQTCVGIISSSSGRTFPYTWDGHALVVTSKPIRNKRQACVTISTGVVEPFEQGSASDVHVQKIGPFTGSATRMTASESEKVSYKFYGDCKPGDTDTVSGKGMFLLEKQA